MEKIVSHQFDIECNFSATMYISFSCLVGERFWDLCCVFYCNLKMMMTTTTTRMSLPATYFDNSHLMFCTVRTWSAVVLTVYQSWCC